MNMLTTYGGAGVAGLVLAAAMLAPLPAAAATRTCGYAWAVPGDYVVSGNFRGTIESTTARLTNDCKIALGIPGVFAGAQIRRAGQCLSFSFKIQGEKQVFTAQWCDRYGIVPWQGRTIRASIVRKKSRSERDSEKSQNFRSRFTGDPDLDRRSPDRK